MLTTRRKLSEMILQELWQLFPISLSSHNPDWRQWAEEEIALLSRLLFQFAPLISHIGSTAVPGIMAKPIVDILVELSSLDDYDSVSRCLESNGYILMNRGEDRMSFNKGYTPEGYEEKVFHIHVHLRGDNDEILFRDYLITHPEEAQKYESLKRSLLPRFRHDRDGYTEMKTEFIKRIVAQDKKLC